ncbi:ATP-binding cassette, subfamily B [Acetitomaculum ruminis DSM 5522]|uniref:ATP-binding cassette, subfamily B n=1 Tax=Acetitomaculum ruminis DSM 5522 TaxID=1120918 RepID=A0A1I0WLA7_9FIRM|nr:ABC transporter ATP-binding protein [Acetitomaculum ruminis]SFA89575.1 ATP-binding cassette, subfamily B [Acetitomaculum ruminis DSM 5522]
MSEKVFKEVKKPEKISSYFKMELPVLIVVTISGILYNAGIGVGPYYEGQLAGKLYEVFKGYSTFFDVLKLAITYVVVLTFVQGMRAIKRYSVRVFSNDVGRLMRHTLYSCLIRMDKEKLNKEGLGALMTKAIADVDICSEGMRKFTTEVFDTGVAMIVYISMLLFYDFKLTLIAGIFTPFAYFLANRLKKQVVRANRRQKMSATLLNHKTMDRVSNAITYRIFGREEARNEALEEALNDYEKNSIKANIFEGSMTPLYNSLTMAGTVIIIYIGSKNVAGSGFTKWDIASFTTYLAVFTKFAVKVSRAAKLFNAIQKAEVSWGRIKPLMKEIEIKKSLLSQKEIQKVNIEFENVSFGHFDNDNNFKALAKSLSFSVKPGQIVGITGIVASGKSSLGKIFIDESCYEGSIRINGEEFKSLSSQQKHEYVSYMGHEPELMSNSIYENVALGDETDVDKWLDMVCLSEEVFEMSDKKETLVGDGGVKLSGGQQARLALARTLSHSRSVMILDDPFSAVDKLTEKIILNNIRKEFKDRIILLISHRLYHFPEFDHVLFLHDGKGEFSNHKLLMENFNDYKELFDKQVKRKDLDEGDN